MPELVPVGYPVVTIDAHGGLELVFADADQAGVFARWFRGRGWLAFCGFLDGPADKSEAERLHERLRPMAELWAAGKLGKDLARAGRDVLRALDGAPAGDF